MNLERTLVSEPIAGAGARATTRLDGVARAGARALWLTAVLLTLALFVAALPARRDELDGQFAGLIPASLTVNAAGQVTLSPWRESAGLWGSAQTGQLFRLGVLEGDILVAVDGAPLQMGPGDPAPESRLAGPIGRPVTLTVRTGAGAPRTYTIVRGGPGAAVLAPLGLTREFVTDVALAVEVVFAAVFLALGAVLFGRRSDDWLALLASGALIALFLGASSPVIALYRSQWQLRPALDFWFSVALLALVTVFYLFPDGRFFPPAVAGLLAVLAGGAALAPFASALYPWRMPATAGFVVICGALGSGVAVQIARYRRHAGPVERQQTKWVLFGLAAATLGLLIKLWLQVTSWPPPDLSILTLYNLALYPLTLALQALLPLSMLFAILRYRLFDINTIINRALVYGALSVAVFAIYVLVVSGLGWLLQSSGSLLVSLPATVVVALLFQPLRERLQRGVNRLMYGERDDPYAVVARLGRRLEAAFQPDAVLPAVVETVAQALKLPYAALTLAQDGAPRIVAEYGTAQSAALRLPLVYAGAPIGELLLASRAPGEPFTAGDRKLLADLARQAGVAAHAAQLHTDLARSRQRIVVAREEARRALGSDLHDGVGHRLAGLLRRAELAGRLLRQDPAAAEATIEELQAQTRATIDNVRALAHTLHPPELELLGLPGALRERATELSGAGAGALEITVEAPESLPALPAAVETAAYYIAQEALTNVARHAGARQAALRLWIRRAAPGESAPSPGPSLELEITDDGAGFSAAPAGAAGLGLASMQERAAELGGSCVAGAAPGGGARIHASLPWPAGE